MADPWPWPVDTALDRARLIAGEYRRHLQQHAPALCDRIDQLMTGFGETWIVGITADDTIVTTTEAAGLLGITPRGVRLAVTRGALQSAGRDGDGYLFRRADVIDYLAKRTRSRVA